MTEHVHTFIHSWQRSTRQVIWPGSIDIRGRKVQPMLNLVQAIEGKLPIHAERRRLCLMMLRLLEEGLLADVAISQSALTPALLVSASRSNDNLARVRCCIMETHVGAYHT